MLRNINNNKQKKENEKIIRRKIKRKSKSINKLNIKKDKKLVDNYLSNQNKNKNELFPFFQETHNNKKFKLRNSRIEINANKPLADKNYFKNSKLKLEDNKESDIIENNNDKKLNEIKENIFNKKNIVIMKNIYEEKKTVKNEIEIKEKEENDKNKNLIEIKKENNKNEISSSKKEIPILNLNEINSISSHSSSNKKNISKNEDLTESNSYTENNFEIKGEILTENEKNIFLNKIKKCLFNSEIKSDFMKYNKTEKSKKISLKENLSVTEIQTIENTFNIKSAYITKAGVDEKKEKKNQDSFLILEKLFENILNIYGIFDGHGKNGNLISNLISQFLSQYLKNKENYFLEKNDNDDSSSDSSESSKEIIINNELISNLFSKEDFIKKIIKELDFKANESNFDLQFSGSTCLLLFLFNDEIICSNIGDSMCVLFNCSNEDRWTYEIISKIHKPDIPSEKKRILEEGGVVHPFYDEFGIYDGPNRVYVKGKTYPGLSLTRSIGDLEAEKIGVISEPDIIFKKKDSTCKYLVLGSDGLWDVIKPYDVRRIVNPYFFRNDPDGACNALMKIASKNWNKEGCDRDDITIIVVFIGTPN